MNAFAEIYKTDKWTNGSGPGSHPAACRPLISFLGDFIKHNKISSLIDFGCGDWQFMSNISLDNVNYLGFDVVSNVIQNNIDKYSNYHINFSITPKLLGHIPGGDVLFIKDVLIHLPNHFIFDLINQFHRYKYIISVNNVADHEGDYNSDISVGEFRPVHLGISPFNLPCANILQFGATRIFDPRLPLPLAFATRKFLWPGKKQVQIIINHEYC